MPTRTTAKKPRAVRATHGEKMLELKVLFFTNGIARRRNAVLPGHGMTRGTVRMDRHIAHALGGGRARPFNSLMELPAAIERVLMDHGVTLHARGKMRRYMRVRPKPGRR
jgi:hypothetical protein